MLIIIIIIITYIPLAYAASPGFDENMYTWEKYNSIGLESTPGWSKYLLY